jgi:L-fuculose-phosphate aldolase
MQKEINCALIAEARIILGTPAITKYALAGTEELAAAITLAAEKNANVILLKNHGIVCLGQDLLTAFNRLEVLETAAKMTVITELMGSVKPLNKEQLREIDEMLL